LFQARQYPNAGAPSPSRPPHCRPVISETPSPTFPPKSKISRSSQLFSTPTYFVTPPKSFFLHLPPYWPPTIPVEKPPFSLTREHHSLLRTMFFFPLTSLVFPVPTSPYPLKRFCPSGEDFDSIAYSSSAFLAYYLFRRLWACFFFLPIHNPPPSPTGCKLYLYHSLPKRCLFSPSPAGSVSRFPQRF